MPITFFRHESGNTEEWLEVNQDGTLTHVKENAGWVMVRKGIDTNRRIMTAENAKAIWPSYATAIDAALAR